jgi:hypothetical protein
MSREQFAVVLCAIISSVCSAGQFGTNIARGSNASISNVYSYWNDGVSGDCNINAGRFSVDDANFGADQDCNMAQTIDITYARDYLLNPGGRVMISLQGYIQGGNPDYATLRLEQLECISGASISTLGGDELRSNAWRTYTWTARLRPNICSVPVKKLENFFGHFSVFDERAEDTVLSMRTLGDVEVVPSFASEDRSQAFRHEAIFFSVPSGHFLVQLRYFAIAFVGGQLQSKRLLLSD